MPNYIINNGQLVNVDELYHHGVKGMKWGVRRQKLGKQEFKQAKKDLRSARKQYKKDIGTAARLTGYSMGIKGIQREKKAYDNLRKAELGVVSAKAKYKSLNSKNSDKAERKVYTREMSKYGLPGSMYDNANRNKSTSLYNNIRKEKGKKYADDILKRTQNQQVAAIIGSTAVMVGATAAQVILANRE